MSSRPSSAARARPCSRRDLLVVQALASLQLEEPRRPRKGRHLDTPAIVGGRRARSASDRLITADCRREIRWPMTNDVAAS